MMKESTTREILFDSFFELVAPDFILTEVHEHEDRVLKATEMTKDELEILLALIFEHIIIISCSEYKEFIELLKGEISDPKDLAYLAVCLAISAQGIWTHDLHFKEQDKVKVFTNIDMLQLSGRAKSD